MEASGQGPIHVAPGEGEMRWVVGDLVTFKMVGEDAKGAFALAEEVTPQGGPPPHLHTREDETFYVVEGKLEFVVGERTFSASAGSVVHGPRGLMHSFRDVGTTPSRMAVIITPAGGTGDVLGGGGRAGRGPILPARRTPGRREACGGRPEVRHRDTAPPA